MAMKDTFYISHGSPTLAIDDSIEIRKFLKSWKQVFPQRPSAILVISGHWDTAVPTVNVVERNETIYDFYGFPRPMYQVRALSTLHLYLGSPLFVHLMVLIFGKVCGETKNRKKGQTFLFLRQKLRIFVI